MNKKSNKIKKQIADSAKRMAVKKKHFFNDDSKSKAKFFKTYKDLYSKDMLKQIENLCESPSLIENKNNNLPTENNTRVNEKIELAKTMLIPTIINEMQSGLLESISKKMKMYYDFSDMVYPDAFLNEVLAKTFIEHMRRAVKKYIIINYPMSFYGAVEINLDIDSKGDNKLLQNPVENEMRELLFESIKAKKKEIKQASNKNVKNVGKLYENWVEVKGKNKSRTVQQKKGV